MAAKKMLESQTNRVINGHINNNNHGHTTNGSRTKSENLQLKFCITGIRYMYTRFDITYILRYTYTNTLHCSYEIYYFYDVTPTSLQHALWFTNLFQAKYQDANEMFI